MEANWTDPLNNSHAGKILFCKGDYKIIDCKFCKFIHSIPIPDDKALDAYYTDTYYQSDRPDYAEQHKQDREWWQMINYNRYSKFESSLGRKGKILDIGCGPGFFLKDGMDLQWDVIGVEPSKEASEYARSLGLNCINTSFTASLFKEESQFDVVIINQAIEHIPYPNLLLREIKSILADDGLVCIVAANDFNALQEVAINKLDLDPWWAVPPEHLNYFSHKSLAELVKSEGFLVVDNSSTFPIDLFLLMGDIYIGDNDKGKMAHSRRKEFETSLYNAGKMDLLNDLYKAFAKLGLGREIDLICRNS